MRSDYDGVVFVVGDSAVFASVSLAPLLGGLGPRKWEEIRFRAPYIGLMQADGWTLEFSGPSESTIAQVLQVSRSD